MTEREGDTRSRNLHHGTGKYIKIKQEIRWETWQNVTSLCCSLLTHDTVSPCCIHWITTSYLVNIEIDLISISEKQRIAWSNLTYLFNAPCKTTSATFTVDVKQASMEQRERIFLTLNMFWVFLRKNKEDIICWAVHVLVVRYFCFTLDRVNTYTIYFPFLPVFMLRGPMVARFLPI